MSSEKKYHVTAKPFGVKKGLVSIKDRVKNYLQNFIYSPQKTAIDSVEWERWGEYDNYPQQCIELANDSSTLRTCINTLSKFIEGDGIENGDILEKSIINSNGETFLEVYKKICNDFATGSTFVINVNYNSLGEITEFQHVPFELTRKEKQDITGKFNNFYIIPDLGQQSLYKSNITYYKLDKFNPTHDVVSSQIERDFKEGERYLGQIYFYQHSQAGARIYPRTLYHSVIPDAITEASLKKTKQRDVESGFTLRAIVTEYGSGEPTEAKKQEDADFYSKFCGADAPTIAVLYAKNQESSPKIDIISPSQVDKLYEYAESSTSQNIMRSFQIPQVLYGVPTSGKLGTSQELQDAVKYVQRIVVNDMQRAIENAFDTIFRYFAPERKQALGVPAKFTIKNLTLEQGNVNSNNQTNNENTAIQ